MWVFLFQVASDALPLEVGKVNFVALDTFVFDLDSEGCHFQVLLIKSPHPQRIGSHQ